MGTCRVGPYVDHTRLAHKKEEVILAIRSDGALMGRTVDLIIEALVRHQKAQWVAASLALPGNLVRISEDGFREQGPLEITRVIEAGFGGPTSACFYLIHRDRFGRELPAPVYRDTEVTVVGSFEAQRREM